MTNRERIEENYEDALFAMWMSDFALRRGERFLAENERLKNDPEAAVPEKLQRKNLNLIYRELRRGTQHFVLRKIGKAALRFVATVAIIGALFGIAYAISPEFRTGTLNVLMDLDERAASFQLMKDESAVPEMLALMPSVTVDWLPEGYEQSLPTSDRLKTTIDCTNAAGDSIHIRVFTEYQSLYSLDIENADTHEDIIIQDQPALLVEKDGILRICWADEDTGTYILVNTSSVDADSLIHVAESVSVSW